MYVLNVRTNHLWCNKQKLICENSQLAFYSHLKYEGNQLVNSTNRNYEKLDNKEEDILFLYTINADCLPNKLQQLKQLLVHFEKSPDIISLTEIKHKNKWEMNSAELTIDQD